MEELIKKSKKGDKNAFTELIISIENDLYKIAKMRLECDDDINEAVQETIIQAFKSISKIKHPEYFKTWIIRILINNCNKVYKKIKKHNLLDICEIEDKQSTNDIEKENNNLDFLILIKNLNYKERISLTLYYLENLTTKEISKIVREPESTIRNRNARAIQKLKKIYEKEDIINEEYRR